MAFTPTIEMQTIDGYVVPKLGFFEKIVRSALQFKPAAGDIILATYPKCGTTWTQYIIWEILNGGKPPPSPNELVFQFCPFLEMTGPGTVEKLTSRPRVIKVHTPYDLTPQSHEAKYIFVSRNPFDCCVSFYHHLNEIDFTLSNLNISFDEYFEHFVRGVVPFGDYFDHTLSWYERRNDPNVLFCSFEDMKADHKKVVLRIAEFLGPRYRAELEENNELLENVLRHSSFEYMKKNLQFRVARNDDALTEKYAEKMAAPTDEELFRTVNFFREGQVGSWRKTMSEDQEIRLKQRLEEKVSDRDLRKILKA